MEVIIEFYSDPEEDIPINPMFDRLKEHVGHTLECVMYGEENVTIECEDCNEVVVSEDKYLVKEEEESLTESEWDDFVKESIETFHRLFDRKEVTEYDPKKEVKQVL